MSTAKRTKPNGKSTSSKKGRLSYLDVYIDAGMRVVGLDGKRPAETGWQKVPFRCRDQIPERHWLRNKYNFGWVLDDTQLVIDVDRHAGGADGWESLDRLIDDLYLDRLDEITPAIVITGGGGCHLYFSKPPGVRIRKTLTNYPGLDFCSKGQQIVAPGAIHPDTKRRYSPNRPFGPKVLMNLPAVPDPLLELLLRNPSNLQDQPSGQNSNVIDRSRVIAALSHIDPDIDYQEWIQILLSLHSIRDDNTYLPIADAWSSLGGKYESAGLNSVECKWDTFDEDPMREPRISIATLFGISKAAGWDGNPTHFGAFICDHSAADVLAPTNHSTRQGPVPITDILATTFKPLEFIVDGLIPDTGVFILSSNPKVGKTTLIHQMCLALMGEVSFLGTKNPRPGGILFLALEDSPRRIKRRTEQIFDAPAFDFRNPIQSFANLMVETEWPNAPDGISKLDKYLSDHPDTQLVVIDTLAAFRGMAASASRQVYQQDYELMKQVKKVADRHEVSILFLHHNRKGQSNSPGEAIGGTHGLTGAVDGYMVLESQGFADSESQLLVQGREIPPQELALKRDDFIFQSLGDASMYTMSAERREVIEVLEDMPNGLGPMDIASELGRSAGSTRKLLTTMYKRGLIRKIKRGLYAPQK